MAFSTSRVSPGQPHRPRSPYFVMHALQVWDTGIHHWTRVSSATQRTLDISAFYLFLSCWGRPKNEPGGPTGQAVSMAALIP
jgi:hypothetical protein